MNKKVIWAAVVLAVLAVGIGLVSHPAGRQSEDPAIIAAAEEGVFQQANPGGSEAARSEWRQNLNRFEPSIVRNGTVRAVVTFYSQKTVMAKQAVARDENGQWRPE